MTNVPLGPGGWHYEKGHRICVSGLGERATKTMLQGAFGEFGHIIKIETPRSGSAAYISFKDRGDAEDAVKAMDGEQIDGQRVAVSRAGERPPPNAAKKEAQQTKASEVLTTVNFEREEKRTARYLDSTGMDKRIQKLPAVEVAAAADARRQASDEKVAAAARAVEGLAAAAGLAAGKAARA
eukprot:CAMPEP_0115268438 /NCGR_PEP_ID=MMETSP0270-20121206/52521_1 /TAXON_ID=71861 /ORGANISM="Scrippsiella trochoidea, Strain CCMP3099" /LENGTH=181 /DNA_ID=CAMNT_0002684641 /DNA_START=38 /DNA_END=580 /DNA_ORIENTATION=+